MRPLYIAIIGLQCLSIQAAELARLGGTIQNKKTKDQIYLSANDDSSYVDIIYREKSKQSEVIINTLTTQEFNKKVHTYISGRNGNTVKDLEVPAVGITMLMSHGTLSEEKFNQRIDDSMEEKGFARGFRFARALVGASVDAIKNTVTVVPTYYTRQATISPRAKKDFKVLLNNEAQNKVRKINKENFSLLLETLRD